MASSTQNRKTARSAQQDQGPAIARVTTWLLACSASFAILGFVARPIFTGGQQVGEDETRLAHVEKSVSELQSDVKTTTISVGTLQSKVDLLIQMMEAKK